jgi:hypothetical protein
MNNPQDNIYYQNDSIELSFEIYKDKVKKLKWDLTDYKIRFELKNSLSRIKKSSEGVIGGSDDEIKITSAEAGEFTVFIPTSESKNLEAADYTYAIQIESPEGNKKTVVQDALRILPALITWENE